MKSEVQLKATSELVPYLHNNRVHNDKQVQRIADSIREFGFNQPIVIDEENVILVGHGRLYAAQKLGMETVPVLRRCGLTPEQRRAYRILDNKLQNDSEWNYDSLNLELDWLEAQEFDLPQWGLDDLKAQIPGQQLEAAEDDYEPPAEPEAIETEIERGDLITLGRHRLLCGDCTESMSWTVASAGAHIAATVSDPPYGIGFKYDAHDDSREHWYRLINDVIPIAVKHSDFVIIPSCGIDRMKWWYENHNPEWLVVWYKGSPGHQSKIGFNDYELHLTWGRPYKAMHDHFQTPCGFKGPDGHPCPKPVKYSAWLVERAADVGCVVFDPFLGSGTTLIACEQLDRTCYGIEISPQYCEIIVQRYIKHCDDNSKPIEITRNGTEWQPVRK